MNPILVEMFRISLLGERKRAYIKYDDMSERYYAHYPTVGDDPACKSFSTLEETKQFLIKYGYHEDNISGQT